MVPYLLINHQVDLLDRVFNALRVMGVKANLSDIAVEIGDSTFQFSQIMRECIESSDLHTTRYRIPANP